MNLQERKLNTDTLLQQKVRELQKLEEARNALTTEVLELRGKVNLLTELIQEKEKPAN